MPPGRILPTALPSSVSSNLPLRLPTTRRKRPDRGLGPNLGQARGNQVLEPDLDLERGLSHQGAGSEPRQGSSTVAQALRANPLPDSSRTEVLPFDSPTSTSANLSPFHHRDPLLAVQKGPPSTSLDPTELINHQLWRCFQLVQPNPPIPRDLLLIERAVNLERLRVMLHGQRGWPPTPSS